MERSTYPQGHEVHQQDLAFTEASKAQNILRRFVDGATMGVAFGLTLQRNSINTTRVDIIVNGTEGKGWGYAPNGEFIEITASQTNLALTDYTDGVVNYICAVYAEILTDPTTHETDGVARPTRAARTFRTLVATAAELDALLASSENMDIDARDRVMVIGTALGNGFTGPTPNALVPGEITQQATLEYVLSATVTTAVNITGVEITAIDPDTAEGNGLLTFTRTTATTATLAWRAPGEGVNGPASANVHSGGVFTLVSVGGLTLTVKCEGVLLPPAIATVTDTVAVESIYEDVSVTFSPADFNHRAKLGGAMPTHDNPHGLTYADLAALVAHIPQLLKLGDDYTDTEAHALLPRLLASVSTAAGSERTLMLRFGTGTGVALRLYVDTNKSMELTANAYWDGASWQKDAGGTRSTMIYLSTFGGIETFYQDDLSWTVWRSSAAILSASPGRPGVINVGEGLLNSLTDALIPRIHADAPANALYERVLVFQSKGGLDTAHHTRIYRNINPSAVGNIGGVEITQNAEWSLAGWSKDDVTAVSFKLDLGTNNFAVLHRTTGAGSWAEGGWGSVPFRVDMSSGNVTTLGTLNVAQTSALQKQITAGAGIGNIGLGDNNLARIYAPIPINSAGAGERWLVFETEDTVLGRGYRQYVFSSAATYRTEIALGCYWDGFNWKVDDPTAGSVHVQRIGPGGTVKYFKTTYPPGGWGDNAWDYTDTAFGNISVISGVITFTGHNISSVGLGATNEELLVTFTTPFLNSPYAVNLSTSGQIITGSYTQLFSSYTLISTSFRISGVTFFGTSSGAPTAITANQVDFGITDAAISFSAKDNT